MREYKINSSVMTWQNNQTYVCANIATIQYKGYCDKGRIRPKTWDKMLSAHTMQYG